MNPSAANGCLYLVPSALSEGGTHAIPEYVKELLQDIQYFYVENLRTARRFLRALDATYDIDSRHFYELPIHDAPDVDLLKHLLSQGISVAVLSEAGYPCVADPGSLLVLAAHRMGVQVKPLVGPSALILALAASGLNGQQFRFHGYLPVKPEQRIRALKDMEPDIRTKAETQIFIEAPYRNQALVQDIVQHGNPDWMLCIARDLSGSQEWIQTRSLSDWALQELPNLHKIPSIFLLGREASYRP